jgi:hypothetical protein
LVGRHREDDEDAGDELRNTPTMSAPISVPMMSPRPPNRLVPPSTTAVMLSRFSVWPACGSPTPVRAIESSEAMP